MTAQINLKDITVKFGENKAVNNVNLETKAIFMV